MLLSHLSPKPSLSPLSSFLSSLALRRPPKSPFCPSHFPKSTPRPRPRPRPSVPPSLACHVSAGNGVRGFVSMDSPSPDLAVSVDSVTHDLKNQSLGGDDRKTLGLRLEDLNWDHSFVRALPGDPRTDTIPREVEEKKRFVSFFFFFFLVALCLFGSWENKRNENPETFVLCF